MYQCHVLVGLGSWIRGLLSSSPESCLCALQHGPYEQFHLQSRKKKNVWTVAFFYNMKAVITVGVKGQNITQYNDKAALMQ